MNMLRKLFGPSKEEIWRQLCTEIGATYVQGDFWNGDKVQASHAEWTITLDTYTIRGPKGSIVYTRLRAPYVNPDHFRFSIYRRGLFSDIAKWFRMQDVDVGHADFDRDFVIKGNDEVKLRALFDDPRLRELIAAQPQIYLTVQHGEAFAFQTSRTDFPADTDELCFQVLGIITDAERLKLLFELFAETLDQMCLIGSAYEGTPKVKL
jgi:hypothetical protein